jgi:ribose transport system ATP-binding protein
VTGIILTIDSISKRFGATQALSNVSFNVEKGEVIGLAGENGSGKSTLIKILCGVHQADSGTVVFMGKEHSPSSPSDAEKAGISVFHQEIPICYNMSVAENIFLGNRIPVKRGMPDKKFMVLETKRLFRELLDEPIDAAKLMRDCTVAERQMALLVRALRKSATLVILDEPTTALAPTEVQKLVTIIKGLKNKGITFIFISHMMDELIEISDKVTVLRDGKLVDELIRGAYDRDELAASIAGKTLDADKKRTRKLSDTIALEISNYRIDEQAEPLNISITSGEIFGVAGLAGSGRSDIVRSLFGAPPAYGGQVKLYGEDISIKCPQDAMQESIGYLPEDRKTMGLFYAQDVKFNLGIANLGQWVEKGIVNLRKLKSLSEKFVGMFNIKMTGISSKITSLSGGNQQKILLSRWLAIQPKVLLMDEPTRGVDVGAKQEIKEIIRQMALEGVTFIIASAEIEELIAFSDRILVMNARAPICILAGKDMTKENIIEASA